MKGTVTERGPPELPVPTGVFAFGHPDVTADVPTGFDVLHETFTEQVLAPTKIVHVDADRVSVPDGGFVWHVLPFHVVPDAQLAVAVLLANSCALLYRKNVRLLNKTWRATAFPLLPVVRVVFRFGVLDVIAEMPTGLLVDHVAFTVQVLAPAAMVQLEADRIRLPLGGARQIDPFQLVPATQDAVALLWSSSS
jgi:hypothetical protein